MASSRARPRPLPASKANHVSAYDFVFGSCANGQRLKCRTVIGGSTLEPGAIDVADAICSGRAIEVLTRLIRERGAPCFPPSDWGLEYIGEADLEWRDIVDVQAALMDPGRLWRKGSDESFNGRFLDECLTAEWFRS